MKKHLLCFVIIFSFVTFTAGCASPRSAAAHLQEPFNFEKLQKRFQEIAAMEKELKSKSDAIGWFLRENAPKLQTERERRQLVRLSAEVGTLRAKSHRGGAGVQQRGVNHLIEKLCPAGVANFYTDES